MEACRRLHPAAASAAGAAATSLRTSRKPAEQGNSFVNPELIWSQPTDEVRRKFGGSVPQVGQVSWLRWSLHHMMYSMCGRGPQEVWRLSAPGAPGEGSWVRVRVGVGI